MLHLRRIDPVPVDWERMDRIPDGVAFQTRQWLEFLRVSQGLEPVVAEVRDDDRTVGYFTGMLLRRAGLRILGSPFPGWQTQYMGFVLEPGVSRAEALEALLRFAFGPLRCRHLEIRDRLLTVEDAAGLGMQHAWGARAHFGRGDTPISTYVLDLRPDEEVLFKAATHAVRKAVRKAAREGVTIERAHDAAFADEFHAQLVDVFAKDTLPPPFGVERVRTLMALMGADEHLLALRARGPDGFCIGTAMFLVDRRRLYFWGSASWRSHQLLRPNEALFWHAVRWGRERGLEELDLGGGGDYKTKYGPVPLSVPIFRRSRPAALGRLRDLAATAVDARRQAEGHVRRRLAERRAGTGTGS